MELGALFVAQTGGGSVSDQGTRKGIPLNPQKNRGRPPKRETIINDYRKHPDEWIENVFNEKRWDKRREIFRDVWNNRYTVVKSCYASGKSYLAACLVLAWVHLWPDSVALTTAST